MASADDVVAAWSALDLTTALHAADRDAVEGSEAARALVVELIVAGDVPASAPAADALAAADDSTAPADLFSACARLGWLLGRAGASPAQLAVTLDHASRALTDGELNAPAAALWLDRGRAALFEGYMAASADAARRAACLAWECPGCLVEVDAVTAAVACGYPSDDPEALGDWAARLALFLSKRGIKRAILSGPDAACGEAREALSLIGIDVVRQIDAAPRGLLGRLFG